MYIKKDTRNCITLELKEIDVFEKDDAFIEATEWANGEGYDFSISSAMGSKVFHLSNTELKAIKILTEIGA